MSYVDDLRRHLEAVRDGSVPWVELRPDQLARHRKTLLRRFEAVEGPSIDDLFERWTEPGFFAEVVERLYFAALGLDVPPAEVAATVDELLVWLVDEDSPHVSLRAAPVPGSLRARVLRDAAEEAARAAMSLRARGLWSVERYARRLGLVREEAHRAAVSASGDVLLRLPTHDTVRWTVALELAMSGSANPWAIPDAFLRRRVTGYSGHERAFAPLAERDALDAEIAMCHRLVAFDLLAPSGAEPDEQEKATGTVLFDPTPRGRDVFDELLGESPLALLAHAVVSDQAAGASGDLLRVASPGEVPPLATVESLRHMRMFAHEIRNALVPVQVAVDRLARLLPSDLPREPAEGLKHTIQVGLTRVFQFIAETSRVARLAPNPPEPFEFMPALRDAFASMAPEFQKFELQHIPEAERLLVVGHRDRFVLAIVNLLRNAQQVGADGFWIAVKLATDEPGVVEIVVDDDGPGIPVEHHSSVFEPGFSLRPDGSGHGLALVREVVEGELGGRIRCTSSPHGGARFTIRLPSARRSAS